MKKSFLSGTLLFLCGLAFGVGVPLVWDHSSNSGTPINPVQPTSQIQRSPVADEPPTKAEQYGVLGTPKAEDYLPTEAYKSFIISETGAPRSFEEFKDLLAKSKMVNPHAASFEREAIMVYAGALVRAFGVNAIDEICKSPILAEFGPAAPGMFEMMYDVHGQEAALKLIESYGNKQIRTMLYGMLAAKTVARNYAEALQIVRQHAPMKLKDPSFISQLVQSAGQKLDRTALLGFVTTLDSPQTRLLAAEAAGAMLWSPNPDERGRTLSSFMAIGDAPLRRSLLDSYLSKAVTVEPDVLLNPAFSGMRIDKEHFHVAGRFMSEKGWDTALAFGMRIPGDETRQRYMMGLVEATVEAGNNSVMDKSIDAYRKGIDDGQMLSRAVSEVARLAPAEAVDFLSRTDLPGELRETLSTECINDIATADIEQAKALVRNNSFTGATRDRIYADMARHLARENPEAAFSDVTTQISDPVYGSIAAKEVAQEYFRSDSNRCLGWLQQIASGPLRDEMTSAVANEMIKTDVLGALNLCTRISDENNRVIAVATLYGNARYIQPSLADSWANQNPAWIKALSDFERSNEVPK